MTPSKSPLSSPAADARALLRGLCRSPDLHARFLNTLSLLEHIGSRKILLSRAGAWEEEALRHLAEEARHAHFFRRAAERTAGRALGYGGNDALAPEASRMYFGRLDASVSRALGAEPGRAYRYVTLLVELRARWLYRLYEEALRAGGSGLTLKGVLAEEDAHLLGMDRALREGDPLYAARREAFSSLESALFGKWLEAVRRAAFPAQAQAGRVTGSARSGSPRPRAGSGAREACRTARSPSR